MLHLSLSKLETARTNPYFIAQSLAGVKAPGGTHGFLSKFKSAARDLHENERGLGESLKALDEKLWLSFQDTPRNRSKRQKFCESFHEYSKLFANLDLTIERFQLNIDWQLIKQMKLTGHSPFLCSSEDKSIAYFFVESIGRWFDELKYPLLQIYLAERFYKCDIDQIKIGVYSVRDMAFDFKTYEDFELEKALEEGKLVLKNVAHAFNKL